MSMNDKLDKVRKPRVHIKYEVETEGGRESKELPFVVGVMGDFSGDPTEPLKPLKERKFTEINGENFDDVMKRMTPGAMFKVKNTLENDGSEIAVDLKFNSMKDFDPAQVVQQVEPLRRLMETRNSLRDLMAKADSSEELDGLLKSVLQSEEEMGSLRGEIVSRLEERISTLKEKLEAAPEGSDTSAIEAEISDAESSLANIKSE
ncbi:MAG: type VI secretion system contractile sheath small subunit [Pseudomonadota bacterium]